MAQSVDFIDGRVGGGGEGRPVGYIYSPLSPFQKTKSVSLRYSISVQKCGRPTEWRPDIGVFNVLEYIYG